MVKLIFVSGVRFRFQKWAIILILIQLIALTKMVSASHDDLELVMQKPNALQLQIFIIMVLAILKGIVYLNCSLFGSASIINSLNESASVLLSVRSNSNSCAGHIVLQCCIFFLFGSFQFVIRLYEGIEIVRVFSFFLNNLQEIISLILILTLLTIVHMSLEDINSQITKLDPTKPGSTVNLKHFISQHLQARQLLNGVSNSFGFIVVLQSGYNLARIVLLSYYSYFMLSQRYKFDVEHVIVAIEVPYRFYAVWYLGKKCDQVILEVRNVLFFNGRGGMVVT